MKNQGIKQVFRFNNLKYFILLLILVSGSIVFAAGEETIKKGSVTADGLTVIESTRYTEIQLKEGVDWSEYTKYEITPVDVSFRKNWKRNYNRSKSSLSGQVTDRDMAKIREGMAKIVYEEFDKALQERGGLTKVDQPDEKTLLFKPEIINLDVYAPDTQSGYSESYIRQAGKATLFLEVHDAVSGEILARWVDTREDPDRGYLEWANRITNENRARIIVRNWAHRLIEGLNKLMSSK